jgi:hypothetical protein
MSDPCPGVPPSVPDPVGPRHFQQFGEPPQVVPPPTPCQRGPKPRIAWASAAFRGMRRTSSASAISRTPRLALPGRTRTHDQYRKPQSRHPALCPHRHQPGLRRSRRAGDLGLEPVLRAARPDVAGPRRGLPRRQVRRQRQVDGRLGIAAPPRWRPRQRRHPACRVGPHHRLRRRHVPFHRQLRPRRADRGLFVQGRRAAGRPALGRDPAPQAPRPLGAPLLSVPELRELVALCASTSIPTAGSRASRPSACRNSTRPTQRARSTLSPP